MSILETRSLALSEIQGHGSDSKSISPFKIASNMPCSVSGIDSHREKYHFQGVITQGKASRLPETCPKRRNSTQKNINHNSCTPNICFSAILSSKNFRCNILRRKRVKRGEKIIKSGNKLLMRSKDSHRDFQQHQKIHHLKTSKFHNPDYNMRKSIRKRVMEPTWLEKYRKPKISGLELRMLIFG